MNTKDIFIYFMFGVVSCIALQNIEDWTWDVKGGRLIGYTSDWSGRGGYSPFYWRRKRKAEDESQRREGRAAPYPPVSWQYRTPASTVPLVNQQSPYFNWVYLKPQHTLLQPQMPVILKPDYSLMPAVQHPIFHQHVVHHPVVVPLVHQHLDGRIPQHPPTHPHHGTVHPLIHLPHIKHVPHDQQKFTDEQIVNALYSKQGSRPVLHPAQRYDDIGNNGLDLRSLYKRPIPSPITYLSTTEVPLSPTFSPIVSSPYTGLPFSHVVTPGVPVSSPHIQRISNNRRGKQYSTLIPTSISTPLHPHHYHSPDARISSFGNVIIHDNNQ